MSEKYRGAPPEPQKPDKMQTMMAAAKEAIDKGEMVDVNKMLDGEQRGGEPPAEPPPEAGPEPDQSRTEAGPEPDQRPDWLPDQYKTPEDMVKAHRELQGLVRNKQTAGVLPKLAQPSEQTAAPTTDWDAYTSEYMETGSLSDQSRQAIKAAGVPDDILDSHLKGLAAQAREYRRTVADLAGGEEQFDAMLDWVGKNVTDETERQIIEGSLAAMDDPARVAFGVERMRQHYQKSPAAQARLEGGTKSQPAPAFQSTEQMLAAMNDPKFDADPAFREEVFARTAEFKRGQTRPM